jgi:hypothetical protein
MAPEHPYDKRAIPCRAPLACAGHAHSRSVGTLVSMFDDGKLVTGIQVRCSTCRLISVSSGPMPCPGGGEPSTSKAIRHPRSMWPFSVTLVSCPGALMMALQRLTVLVGPMQNPPPDKAAERMHRGGAGHLERRSTG